MIARGPRASNRNLGRTKQGGPYSGGKYFSPYDIPRLPDGPPAKYLTARLAEETARFILRVPQSTVFGVAALQLRFHAPFRRGLTGAGISSRKRHGWS